eukprot:scaffold8076_cov524-Prasinococcus_capsulatus_cf.AAC.2
MLQLPAVQRKHRCVAALLDCVAALLVARRVVSAGQWSMCATLISVARCRPIRARVDFVVSGDKNTWADVSVQLTNKDPKALERSPSLRNHASAATSTSNTSPASATATATSGSSSASPTSPSSATRMLAAGGTSSSKASDTNQAAIAHRARQVAEKSLQALSIQSGGSGGTSPSYTLSGGADGRRASSRRNDSADCLIVVDVNSPSYAMTGEDPFAASVAFDEVHVQELQASSAAGTTPRHGAHGRASYRRVDQRENVE